MFELHFRITVVDGFNFRTYVKDITRDCGLGGVMLECAEGKLLEDTAQNAIEEIRIEHLSTREQGDVGDVVRVYLTSAQLRVGHVIESSYTNIWCRVTKVSDSLDYSDPDNRTRKITVEYIDSEGGTDTWECPSDKQFRFQERR